MLKKNIEIELELTPEELASMFWNMSDKEQASFFNFVGKHKYRDISMQMEFISSCDNLNDDGRTFMSKIGEYSLENIKN